MYSNTPWVQKEYIKVQMNELELILETFQSNNGGECQEQQTPC